MDTGIKTSSKIVEEIIAPTFTLCFNPMAKLSILDQNGLTLGQFVEGEMPKNENKSWLDVYNDAYYKIGVDFSIILTNYNDYYLHLKSLKQKNDSMGKIEEIYTIWSGLCYKIVPNYTHNAINNVLEWVVLFHVTTKDTPKKVQVIITSEENSYGVVDKQWIEGSELNHELDTSDPTFYRFSLKTFKYEKDQSTSGCSHQKSYLNCSAIRYIFKKINIWLHVSASRLSVISQTHNS